MASTMRGMAFGYGHARMLQNPTKDNSKESELVVLVSDSTASPESLNPEVNSSEVVIAAEEPIGENRDVIDNSTNEISGAIEADTSPTADEVPDQVDFSVLEAAVFDSSTEASIEEPTTTNVELGQDLVLTSGVMIEPAPAGDTLNTQDLASAPVEDKKIKTGPRPPSKKFGKTSGQKKVNTPKVET